MDKISKSSLNFGNKASAKTNNISNDVTKLNTNKNEVKIEYVNSFGDAVLEAFGSNNITKSSAMEILEDSYLNFIDEEDIEEAIRCGLNSENIKIILKNGDTYLFNPNGSDYVLYSFESNGNTATFDNGLSELYDNIFFDSRWEPYIKNISLHDDTLVITKEPGRHIYYDTSNNNELLGFGYQGNYYSVEEIKKGINAYKEKEISELKDSLGSFLSSQELASRIQHIEDAYSFDKIEKFLVEDYGVGIDLEDIYTFWSVKFENNKATSVVYYDSQSPYIDGHMILDID